MTDQELRQLQWDAAQRYVSGVRDHFLVVDWKSVWYYASLFAKREVYCKEEPTNA